VIGAFVCGTTGEGISLSLAERMQVAERWCTAAGPQLRVFDARLCQAQMLPVFRP
jgi:N-acetylneuraminate lyase